MQREAIQFPIKDSGLREDVHALGDLIGEVLLDQGGEEFFDTVEGDRVAALERRKADRAPGAAAALEGRSRRSALDRYAQHSGTLTARPPCEVSL
jgi:phosphoenolpyruvate carboxylase